MRGQAVRASRFSSFTLTRPEPEFVRHLQELEGPEKSVKLDQNAYLSLALPEVEPLIQRDHRMETVGSSKGSAHDPEPPPTLSGWWQAA